MVFVNVVEDREKFLSSLWLIPQMQTETYISMYSIWRTLPFFLVQLPNGGWRQSLGNISSLGEMTQRHHHREFPKETSRLPASCTSLWVEWYHLAGRWAASNKAPKRKARHNCVQCNDVSKMTELTQNYPQQLQLESELRQETVMWETKMSSMGHFQEGTSANTSLLPTPSHSVTSGLTYYVSKTSSVFSLFNQPG